MSRVGSEIIDYQGLEVKLEDNNVVIKGGNQSLSVVLHDGFELVCKGNKLSIQPPKEMTLFQQKIWGTQVRLIKNAVTGIKNPFKRNLKIIGVGYKTFLEGKKMKFQLGFSHEVFVDLPDNINVRLLNPTSIEVSSHDKQAVGAFAVKLCKLKKYNVYNGSGILDSKKSYRKKETKAKK